MKQKERAGLSRPARYRRWLGIGGSDPFVRTLRKAQSLGMQVINGNKPGMCCWYALALLATPQQMKDLESWWDQEGLTWQPQRPAGAWDVSIKGAPIPWDEVMQNAVKVGAG